ncbi:hypothetical protein [Caballeronia glathei]|uniref:Uncharacterized protein n=1 Tax=Caballeronia glathei TaxID=60547 RepID=A0A069PGN2_9BURK|nr:hypothetical protein [Caballeronia glathei]KDR39009.1 hypothetical protein BG61_35355 [Caballeronia glathei]
MLKTSSIVVVALTAAVIAAPLAIHAVANYERTVAEKRFAELSVQQDNAPVTHRKYAMNGVTRYETCAKGWCTESAYRGDVDQFNGPIEARGGSVPVFDARAWQSRR